MSVYFCNESVIDLEVVRLMGVSVKSEGSIGYFGTGLKFAIATLLRFNQSIRIQRDGVNHEIDTITKEIRDDHFDVVRLDGKDLGFTTNLGRNWEVWQAYRELHSNCLDEGGVISDQLPPGEWGTIIEIAGDLSDSAYRDRALIFIDTRPVWASDECEIHTGTSAFGFYRGVRATSLPRPSFHTYNMKFNLELTEDRTVKHQHVYSMMIAKALVKCEDPNLLEGALLSGDGYIEGCIDVNGWGWNPSDAFIRVCGAYESNPTLNKTARALWAKTVQMESARREADLSELNESDLEMAFLLLASLECRISRDDFTVVENLGGGVYGAVSGGRIYIDRKAFDRGPRFIASTIYEEWVHKNLGYKDESRTLQDFLLDKLFYFVDLSGRLKDVTGDPMSHTLRRK